MSNKAQKKLRKFLKLPHHSIKTKGRFAFLVAAISHTIICETHLNPFLLSNPLKGTAYIPFLLIFQPSSIDGHDAITWPVLIVNAEEQLKLASYFPLFVMHCPLWNMQMMTPC